MRFGWTKNGKTVSVDLGSLGSPMQFGSAVCRNPIIGLSLLCSTERASSWRIVIQMDSHFDFGQRLKNPAIANRDD